MILTIAAVAIAVAIVYTLILIKGVQDSATAWSWGHAILSTLVSVMLAMATGLWVLRIQANQQDLEERARWKKLIAAEYSDISLGLAGDGMNVNFPGNNPPQSIPILITYIQPIAAEQAALSGKFSANTSYELLGLAQATRAYDMKATYALQLLAQGDVSPNYSERVAHAALNLQRSKDSINAYLKDVMALMSKE
jgi:hypothetical protein